MENYIKVRDGIGLERGWARKQGGKIILDNDFQRIKVGSELLIDNQHNIIKYKDNGIWKENK